MPGVNQPISDGACKTNPDPTKKPPRRTRIKISSLAGPLTLRRRPLSRMAPSHLSRLHWLSLSIDPESGPLSLLRQSELYSRGLKATGDRRQTCTPTSAYRTLTEPLAVTSPSTSPGRDWPPAARPAGQSAVGGGLEFTPGPRSPESDSDSVRSSPAERDARPVSVHL